MQFKTSAGSTGVTVGGTTYTPNASGIITVADSSVTNSLVSSFIAIGILPFFATDPTATAPGVAGAVSDSQSAPITYATPLTSGVPATPGRGLQYVCTTAGTVTITLSSGSAFTIPIPVSTSVVIMPYAATKVVFGSGFLFWNVG